MKRLIRETEKPSFPAQCRVLAEAAVLWGLLAVGAVLAGAVCLKDKLDRMEETLKAVSKTLQEVKTELETVKGRQEVAEIKLDTVAAKLDTARDID